MTDEFVTQREFDMVREHLRELRAADQRALEIKQDADDKAKLLEQDVRAYKDASQNEWRGESADRAALYAPKTEVAEQMKTVMSKLDPVLAWVESQKGRSAGISAQAAILMGLAGLVLTGLLVFLALAAR